MALSEVQQSAVDLLVTQPQMTYQEIAQRCGISDRTLFNWRQEEDFQSAIAARGGQAVDSALYAEAVAGNVQAMKLYLQRFNLLQEKVDDSDRALYDLDAKELDRIKELVARQWLAKK